MHPEIQSYNDSLAPGEKQICDILAKTIDKGLSGSESKIWHAHPVWFLEGNPIVGFSKLKGGIRLLFWSGQSFDEAALQPEGKFKAAEARYADASEVKTKDLQAWLKKAAAIQWDYKNIVKRRGVLEPLKGIKGVKVLKKSESPRSKSPSQLIDAKIKELGDWRGKMLSRLRSIVKEADPGVVEELKWRGVPVWSHDGILCTGETYKSVVKMTFAKGAALKDPSKLFNSSLEGNTRRAIDFHEGDKIDEKALKTLIRAAVTLNKSKSTS